MLKIALMQIKPPTPVLEIEQTKANGCGFIVVLVIAECWHIKFWHMRCV